jgi:ferredoxin
VKAVVDRDACTGCELCVETCPDVFEMDDEGIAVVKVDEVPAEAAETCREAAADCPSDAISIVE